MTKSGFQALVRLHEKYQEQGFEIFAFPCNQFGSQDPKPEPEIKEFVQKRFGVKFNMFSKINVNGDEAHPVYKFLKSCFPGDLTWNFSSKFLVNRSGIPIARFEKESWEAIDAAIAKALSEKPEGKASM